MEGITPRSTEVDTSDCDEVTESGPPVLRLWEHIMHIRYLNNTILVVYGMQLLISSDLECAF